MTHYLSIPPDRPKGWTGVFLYSDFDFAASQFNCANWHDHVLLARAIGVIANHVALERGFESIFAANATIRGQIIDHACASIRGTP